MRERAFFAPLADLRVDDATELHVALVPYHPAEQTAGTTEDQVQLVDGHLGGREWGIWEVPREGARPRAGVRTPASAGRPVPFFAHTSSGVSIRPISSPSRKGMTLLMASSPSGSCAGARRTDAPRLAPPSDRSGDADAAVKSPAMREQTHLRRREALIALAAGVGARPA